MCRLVDLPILPRMDDKVSRPGRETGRKGAGHPLELLITFEGGAGVTRVVGREEVLFATAAALSVGQRLSGMLHLPTDGEAAGLAVCYVAQVARVLRSPARPDGAFEVSARFERLDLVPCAGARA